MKKILVVCFLFIVLALQAFGAGTSTITKTKVAAGGNADEWIVLTVVWVAHTDHSFSDVTISAATYGIEGYQLVAIETFPGATAPTNSYTTNIKDALGVTIGTNTGSATVGVISAGSYMIPVTGDLTFNIGSNSVNSATATCKLFFAKRVYPLS
jgi:hypothetical protein